MLKIKPEKYDKDNIDRYINSIIGEYFYEFIFYDESIHRLYNDILLMLDEKAEENDRILNIKIYENKKIKISKSMKKKQNDLRKVMQEYVYYKEDNIMYKKTKNEIKYFTDKIADIIKKSNPELQFNIQPYNMTYNNNSVNFADHKNVWVKYIIQNKLLCYDRDIEDLVNAEYFIFVKNMIYSIYEVHTDIIVTDENNNTIDGVEDVVYNFILDAMEKTHIDTKKLSFIKNNNLEDYLIQKTPTKKGGTRKKRSNK